MQTFEDLVTVIEEEIHKKRSKWSLTAIQWMDYDDVSQILRIHIYKKWIMWDQKRPIRPWLHKIISNQITNLIRNIYGSHSRPCISLKCAANEGDSLCSLYGSQGIACPFYAKWLKTKKTANDIKLPLALDFHSNELSERPEQSRLNIDRASIELHEKMKEILKPIEYKVYKFLYIDGCPECDLGKHMGFKTTEKARVSGYRQIVNIKKNIIKKANKIVYSGEIDL